ncbi:hypothetical protein BCR34DRAFT_317995 [Clohesyomyces aquaticus]|uniref:Uncharacterized protein n=1 Tax=Clohesyomyces aquaticus TaxID=1231657 RepID=A0A1Y1ZN02_9PLEO|nr:hypothetical protein BCR34DRAFT_317995 [Clohesyomyces aquaticus]
MSSTELSVKNGTAHYRQALVLDGKVVRVHEYRRRPHLVSQMGSPSSHRPDQTSTSSNDRMESKSRDVKSREARKSPSSRRGGVDPAKHVTMSAPVHVQPNRSTQPNRPKQRAVILQKNKPSLVAESEVIQSSTPLVLTPPPTPKIGRLPTPELPDLDERPFCDCCVEAHVAKYCASCRCKLDRPFW